MNYEETFQRRGALYNQAHAIAPQARAAEGQAMLRWLVPRSGETIVVAAAGGGFDACKIASAVGQESAKIICVEPSPVFSAIIPETFEVHNTPLHEIPLEDESADAVVSLAALHHVENRQEVFREWDRMLKPGGRIVLGDVQEGAPNARFLNTIVDRYTPGGHDGTFLRPNELTENFARLGYVSLSEDLEHFHWEFRSSDEMIEFTKCLFGMVNGSDSDIQSGVEEYLVLNGERGDRGLSYAWSLRFFKGIKPTHRHQGVRAASDARSH